MCDLNDFANDFKFLLDLKSYLKEYIETNASKNVGDEINKGIHSKLVDGRSIRIVLPRGCDVLRSVSLENDLNFVGFIGFCKPADQVSETLRDKVWDIDGKLIEEFSNHEDIIAYLSAERTIGGEWGNLVLLQSFDAIEKWRDCPVHHTAINEIAPLYYTRVRIHRGRIQNGSISPDQTLFLDYDVMPTHRYVKIKSYLKQYLEANTTSYEDTIRKGIYSKLTDGRSIRLVLPQGREGLRNISLDDINFVGFIGFSKPAEQLTETLKDEVWKIDGKLIEEFSNHGDILAYVTAERTVGGDSGNLVLLKSLEAIKEWTNCSIHHLAIREISPHYYSKVRIHRGRFVNGKTCTYQTLFIDYGFTPPNRFVKIWV